MYNNHKKNGDVPDMQSAKADFSTVVTVADLPFFMRNLGDIINLCAGLAADKADEVLRSAVEALFGPAKERLGLEVAEAQAEVNSIGATIARLKEQLNAMPKKQDVQGGDTGPRVPRGFNRFAFIACSSAVFVVSVGDGFNAAYLAARELQSMWAGMAFLLPALMAPLVAKVAISRLPPRPRFWGESLMGFFGLITAGFFFYQFVSVFAAPRTLDQVADGTRPGMQWLYLAILVLGFNVVYVLLSSASAMLRPGVVMADDQEGKRFGIEEINTQLTKLEQEHTVAQAGLEFAVAAQPLRHTKIEELKQFTLNLAVGACEVKRKATSAARQAAASAAETEAKAAGNIWDSFSGLLRNGNAKIVNGSTPSPDHESE